MDCGVTRRAGSNAPDQETLSDPQQGLKADSRDPNIKGPSRRAGVVLPRTLNGPRSLD